jgi:hypothetical protein
MRRLAGVSALLCIVVAIPMKLVGFSDSMRYLPPKAITNIWGLDPFGSTPAGFLPQVLYAITGAGGIVLLQAGLSGVAWALLSVMMLRVVAGRSGFAVAAAVLLFSWSPLVHSWIRVASPESLSISLMVLWMTSMLLVMDSRTRRTSSIVLACASGLLPLTVRPHLIIVILPMQLIMLWLVRRSTLSGLERWLPRAVVLVGFLWSGWIMWRVKVDPELRRWYALTNMTFRRSFRNRFLSSLPDCPELRRAIEASDWTDVYRQIGSLEHSCGEADRWLTTAAPGFVDWVLQQPVHVLSSFFREIPFQLRVLEPISGTPIAGSGVWAAGVALVVGLALAVLRSPRRAPTRVAWTVAGAGIASIGVLLLLVWGADGTEVRRHAMPISVLLPVLLLAGPLLLLAPAARSDGR